MKKLLILILLALGYQTASAQLVTESFGTGGNAFTMDFVTIGNPNNAADTTGAPNPAGSVAYTYNLGKYEVSRGQVDKANSAGNLGITMSDMSSYGGNGVNRPATGVTWNEVATYVNWLNTSTGGTAAYKFVGGTFTLWSAGDNGYNARNMFRNSLAKYVIASSNEWYKGAYGKADGSWSNFPNGSDSAPTAVASGKVANTAVYGQFDFTGPVDIDNAGGLSAYGTMGQGGNVWEWEETADDGTNNTAGERREQRGGSYSSSSLGLDASFRLIDYVGGYPADGGYGIGFRVAMIPEPSPITLILYGLLCVIGFRRLCKNSKGLTLSLLLGSLLWGYEAKGEIIDPSLSHQLVTIQSSPSVPYSFKISQNMTSLNDWCIFLNSKVKTSDSFNLYKPRDFSRSLDSGVYSYSLLNTAEGANPVRGINLFDAYRYINWIENGANENADTETGTYSLLGLDINKGDLAQRSGAAKYFLGTNDQWLGSLGLINTPLNYFEWTDVANVYNFPIFMYAYNHYENGAIAPIAWADIPTRTWGIPDGELSFRVASIPEPSSISLLALGGVVVALRRRR